MASSIPRAWPAELTQNALPPPPGPPHSPSSASPVFQLSSQSLRAFPLEMSPLEAVCPPCLLPPGEHRGPGRLPESGLRLLLTNSDDDVNSPSVKVSLTRTGARAAQDRAVWPLPAVPTLSLECPPQSGHSAGASDYDSYIASNRIPRLSPQLTGHLSPGRLAGTDLEESGGAQGAVPQQVQRSSAEKCKTLLPVVT